MKNIWTKIIFSFLAAFATTVTFAQKQNMDTQQDYSQSCDDCDPCSSCCAEPCAMPIAPTTAAYNGTARMDLRCGWDTYLTASFLYWQPKQKGIELGQLFSANTVTNVVSQNIINMNIDYTPAFKVGIGMYSECDDWDTYLEYTRFNSKDSSSKSTSTTNTDADFMDSAWLVDYMNDQIPNSQVNPYRVNYINSNWKLNINLLDLELARPYYVGKQLTFRPHVGLKGGWLDQKYGSNITVIYTGDFSTTYQLNYSAKSDSWLIGPRAGLDTNWILGCNFRLFGNMAASLFYQKFDVKATQVLPVQTGVSSAISLEQKNSDWGYINPNVEFGLGLGWGTCFCDNTWGLDFTVGYDFCYFWNQGMIRNLNDSFKLADFNVDSNTADLGLHGLTITAKLDF